jgi:hypothetical protein
LPSVESASMWGTASKSLMIPDPAPLADDISGTKLNMLPAEIDPNVVL